MKGDDESNENDENVLQKGQPEFVVTHLDSQRKGNGPMMSEDATDKDE